MSKLLAAAKEYAQLGWRVFPIFAITPSGGCECGDPDCLRIGKHPSLRGWPTEATTDLKKIEKWWKAYPDRGVGIATGKESGLSVLDVDGDEGVEALTALAKDAGGMPPTPCVTTRPGRYHYYFSYHPDVKSQAGKIGPKLDSRGDGGYVVAPPSRHAAGGVYTWLQTPFKVELAPWPEFLWGKGGGGEKAGAAKRGRPPKENFNAGNPRDVERLVEALHYIDPDDEERWAHIGWILGRAFSQSDAGFAVYCAWAGRSRKYDAKRSKKHYYEGSKNPSKGEVKTSHSLFAWASEAGWKPIDPEEVETREFNIYENPYREEAMINEFIAAATASPAIFVMDKRLVRIVHYGSSGVADPAIDRDPTAYVVWEHDPDTLAVEFGNIAAFWAKRAKGYERAAFPRRSIQTFLSYRKYQFGDARIKPLDAFVSHPTLRANGSIIDKVGYDPASRLFLTSELPGLQINSRLSQKAAAGALKTLLEPFSEYPWAAPIDRAVFCAALFTVGLRHLFDVAPLFAFSSPKHGSGKTQLAECLSRLWYGITLSKATWTPNPEEMEKRIAAFLLAGDRIVCLDNVTEGQRLEDSTLNKVLTSRKNTFRLLGKTERIELTNEATWFATGNQLLLSGDISRRALVCYIDAKVIDPAARRFTINNLPAHIMKNRAPLMSAALSLVASWIGAGRPVVREAERDYGSFTAWYGLIRPMLLWAGEEDIAEMLNKLSDEDTEGIALDFFANALRICLPPDDTRLSLIQIMGLFPKNDILRATFVGCCTKEHTEPNYRNVSALLMRCENKIFISDNPGHAFTLTKRRDRGDNVWRWGIEER